MMLAFNSSFLVLHVVIGMIEMLFEQSDNFFTLDVNAGLHQPNDLFFSVDRGISEVVPGVFELCDVVHQSRREIVDER
jgi:hypothetical protein